MASIKAKKRNKGKNGKRRADNAGHVWGVGPIYDSFAIVGMMALGILPKSGKTLEKAFASGHIQSSKGAYKLVRPSALAYTRALEVGSNPEKYRKVLAKMGLVEHLID